MKATSELCALGYIGVRSRRDWRRTGSRCAAGPGA